MNADGKITFKELNSMLVFGKNNVGKFIYIDDCANGYDCNLVCPFCGEKLNAKNGGAINAHHFAHRTGSECVQGHVNTLPLLIKRLLEKEKRMRFPPGLIRINGELLNDDFDVDVVDVKLQKLESNGFYVIVTTKKEKKVAIYPYMYSLINHNEMNEILKNNENVITIDYERYKNTDNPVENIVLLSLIEDEAYKKWLRRYDELIIAKKLNELAIMKTFGIDRKGFKYFYCPKAKQVATASIASSICSYCSMCLKNVAGEYGFNDERCLGYYKFTDAASIMNASLVDLSNISGPSERELRAVVIDGKEWFFLNDIPKLFSSNKRIRIFNKYMHCCYFTDFSKTNGNNYLGHRISDSGVIDEELSSIPTDYDGYWRIL